MNRRGPLYVLIAAGVLAAGCAATPPVTHVPIAELAADAGRLPSRGYLSTGQPDVSTLEAIAAAGYAGVVDLRTADEARGYDEAGTATALGLRYVSLPVAGPADVTWENAAALDRVLADMEGPVLLHCASGNRVGALFALRASTAGASDEEALEVGRRAGLTRLEGAVRRRLEAR